MIFGKRKNHYRNMHLESQPKDIIIIKRNAFFTRDESKKKKRGFIISINPAPKKAGMIAHSTINFAIIYRLKIGGWVVYTFK